MASLDRTAYPVYRRTPSLVELERHYTLTAEEQEWLQANTRRPAGLLCCAVLLKAVQHLGYFPVLSLVPASVIAHLRLALALPETVSIFGVSGRSVKTYIQRIREHQGLTSHGRTVRHLALMAMLQAAETSDAPVDLINVALEVLHTQRAEFPAFSTLRSPGPPRTNLLPGPPGRAAAEPPDGLRGCASLRLAHPRPRPPLHALE